MINVNQKFIDSCNSDYVLSQLKIKLSINKAGTVLCTLNDDEFNISSNSVEKQASSGAVCNIGGVCSNRIKIVLNQKGIEKVQAVDGFKKNYVLHLIQWNKVDDVNQSDIDYSENTDHSENTTGKCDLGFYYISQIKNNYYDCEITAYDGMLAFDRNLTITQLKYMMTNRKTVDQWLSYFCSLVNDNNFNISYTDNADVTCNDAVEFTLSDDSSFDKIRDAISQLAMLKMAYATIDTEGNLTLKQAIKTNTSTYDDTIDNEYMFNSDNEVVESVIKYFYTSVAGFEYENNYTDQQNRNEINLFLEENKFLRGFEPYNGASLTAQTLTCLRNMSLEVMGYSFYSCECDINERPYIELGDNIEVERKLVNQQGQVSIISLPLVVDSVGHEIGATTHLTSNSTVGTNEGSNTKTRINSQPKDPSNKYILDILKSPVVKYTDTTASVVIRLDSEESEAFDNKEYADNLPLTDIDFEYVQQQVGSFQEDIAYLLTHPESINKDIFSRHVEESINKSYVYNVRYDMNWYPDNIKRLIEKYNVSLDISANFSNVIGKKFLFFATNSTTSYHKDPVQATITGIYFWRGESNTNAPLCDAVIRDDRYDNLNNRNMRQPLFNSLTSKAFKTVNTHNKIDEGLKVVDIGSIRGTGYVVDSPFTFTNYYLTTPNGFNIKSHVESGNLSSPTRLQYINAANFNVATNIKKQLIKYWLLCNNKTIAGSYGGLFNSSSCIEVRIEYDFNGNHEDVYIPLSLLMAHAGYGDLPSVGYGSTGIYTSLEAYDYIDNWIRTNVSWNNYLDLLKAIYENIKLNWYEVYIEATYLTSEAPLTNADKNKIDMGIINESDVEDLKTLIETNTQAIENLSNYVDEVNNDLQQTKQTVTQNGQDIQQNTTDIGALDIRVTNLEQGGGGGGGPVVIANPQGTPTADLNALQVGSTIYAIPSGGIVHIPRSKMQLIHGFIADSNGFVEWISNSSSAALTLIIDVRDYTGKFINLCWQDKQNRVNRTRVGRLSQLPVDGTGFIDTLSWIWLSSETGIIWYPSTIQAGTVNGRANVGSWGTGYCNSIHDIYIDTDTKYIGVYYSNDSSINMNDLLIKATVEDQSI